MKYSIVVVTYNSGKEIDACLSSIRQHTDDYEVIIVDNASSDDTVQRCIPHNHIVIRNDTNVGYSKAVNQGIRGSSGDLIITLNPDTRVYQYWADNMASKLSSVVGAVGPLSNNCLGYQHVHVIHPFLRQFQSEEELAKLVTTDTRCRGAWYYTKILIGFCMMIPRHIINEVGLMDEGLFLGNDDLDYCWRLQYSNYRMVIAKDSFIGHDIQKSFASKPKSETDSLVQESTDKLYVKLCKYFGSQEKVPNPMELWGINWFKPSHLTKEP